MKRFFDRLTSQHRQPKTEQMSLPPAAPGPNPDWFMATYPIGERVYMWEFYGQVPRSLGNLMISTLGSGSGFNDVRRTMNVDPIVITDTDVSQLVKHLAATLIIDAQLTDSLLPKIVVHELIEPFAIDAQAGVMHYEIPLSEVFS